MNATTGRTHKLRRVSDSVLELIPSRSGIGEGILVVCLGVVISVLVAWFSSVLTLGWRVFSYVVFVLPGAATALLGLHYALGPFQVAAFDRATGLVKLYAGLRFIRVRVELAAIAVRDVHAVTLEQHTVGADLSWESYKLGLAIIGRPPVPLVDHTLREALLEEGASIAKWLGVPFTERITSSGVPIA